MLDHVLCIDVEASGLHEGSFPIELGWASFDGRSGGWLIRPTLEWTLEDWDEEAEAVHAISWDGLQRNGLPARDVAEAFARLFGGPPQMQLVSDAADHDQRWLDRLFEETPLTAPPLGEAEALAIQLMGRGGGHRLIERLNAARRHHRAEADACVLRSALRDLARC